MGMVTPDAYAVQRDVTRKTVLRWIEGGMPSDGATYGRRVDEGVADAWLAERDALRAAREASLSVQDYAALRGVSGMTVRRWIERGMPCAVRRLRGSTIDRAEADAWVDDLKSGKRGEFMGPGWDPFAIG